MSDITSNVDTKGNFSEATCGYLRPAVVKIWAEELMAKVAYKPSEGNVVAMGSLGNQDRAVAYLSMLAREGVGKEDMLAPFTEDADFSSFLGHLIDKNPAIFPSYAKTIKHRSLDKNN